jgi:hypothetical protein
MTNWRIWLGIDDDRDLVFGALGEHACAGAGMYAQRMLFTDVPVRLDGPPASAEIPCVVAIDAALVLGKPDVVDQLPEGFGCVLVVPQDFPDEEIGDAHEALGNRPAWVALSHSAISGEFGRAQPWGWTLHDPDSISQFLPFAVHCREHLARACARQRGALICADVFYGSDDTAAITGWSLQRLLTCRGNLSWHYYRRFWRRCGTRTFIWVHDRLRPEFRALLDALPPHPSGRPRRDIEVISDGGMEESADGRTLWQVVEVEWLRPR